ATGPAPGADGPAPAPAPWLFTTTGSGGSIRIVQPAPDVCRAAGASACWRGVYRPGGTGPALPWNGTRD
ncbi:MAG: hypothetical protein RJQ03_02330, partial [Miltoncostaeaceae bacterium]